MNSGNSNPNKLSGYLHIDKRGLTHQSIDITAGRQQYESASVKPRFRNASVATIRMLKMTYLLSRFDLVAKENLRPVPLANHVHKKAH